MNISTAANVTPTTATPLRTGWCQRFCQARGVRVTIAFTADLERYLYIHLQSHEGRSGIGQCAAQEFRCFAAIELQHDGRDGPIDGLARIDGAERRRAR